MIFKRILRGLSEKNKKFGIQMLRCFIIKRTTLSLNWQLLIRFLKNTLKT